MFYADIEGHPSDQAVRHAFDELRFFSNESRILGVYKASPLRKELARQSAVARIKGHEYRTGRYCLPLDQSLPFVSAWRLVKRALPRPVPMVSTPQRVRP